MTAENEWLPLFPEDEIPRILRIVERCARSLRKIKPTELENDLSDRLRDLIDQDVEFRRDVDAELMREVPIYDRKIPRKKQLGRGDIKFLHGTEGKSLILTFSSKLSASMSLFRVAGHPSSRNMSPDRKA